MIRTEKVGVTHLYCSLSSGVQTSFSAFMIFICFMKVDLPASPQPNRRIFTRLFIFFFSSAISFSINLLILARSSSDSISCCSVNKQQSTITLTAAHASQFVISRLCYCYHQHVWNENLTRGRKQFLIKNCNLNKLCDG